MKSAMKIGCTAAKRHSAGVRALGGVHVGGRMVRVRRSAVLLSFLSLSLGVVLLTFAAVSFSGSSLQPVEEVGLQLADFTVSQSVLHDLGFGSSQTPARRTPRTQLSRKTRGALDEMKRLNARLESMNRHQRDVVFRLEKRRLALAHCDHIGCRAASPQKLQERRLISQLERMDDDDDAEPEDDEEDGDHGDDADDDVEDPEEYKEVMRNNYRTSGGTQDPKSVGTFRIGDPVLNKHDKSVFRRRCEHDRDCVTDDWRTLSKAWRDDPEHRERQKLWRKTTQIDRSIDISADEDMQAQLDSLIQDTERNIDECQQEFEQVGEDAMEHCERRAVRHTCYVFESQSQLCDFASASRHDALTGTVYFPKSALPQACQSAERKKLMGLCRPAEKLPGVAMSHWPWQGHSVNLNKRGFSGDSFLGPYGLSGRSDYWPHTRDIPNNKMRDKSLSYLIGGGGHSWGDEVVGGMGG